MQKEHSTNGRQAMLQMTKVGEPQGSFNQGCPYFALIDDPETTLLFPSSLGHCYRDTPPTPISLNHQEIHCLTARHKSCPVYLQAGPLPASLRGQEVDTGNGRKRGAIVLALIAVGLMAALAVAWGSSLLNLNGSSTSQTGPGEAPAVALLSTQTATATATAAATETAVPPTALPTATETAVPDSTAIPEPTPTFTPPATATPIPTTELLPTLTPVPPLPQVIVQAERLNVRTGPSTEYPAITVVEAGSTFDVIGRLNDGTWWQICCVADEPAWVIAAGVELWGLVDLVPVVEVPPLPTPEPTN